MEESKPLKIIILGAGPAGLCAAWNLVQDGHSVVVLEKEAFCGGQSITFQRGDYRYDLGPHNIHSQHKNIIGFLKKNLSDNFVKHNFSAQIYFRKKRINYPFVGVDIIKSINLFTAISCMFSFLLARFNAFFTFKFKDDKNYERWVVNRFGRKFYNIYFAPYSQKVWRIAPRMLSEVVAKKRIAVSGIAELIRSLIFKEQRYHPENPSMVNNYYPQAGVGMISDFFAEGIVKGGGQIINGASVEKIVLDGHLVQKIYYSTNTETKCFDFEAHKENNFRYKVISTIPVNELVLMLEGNVPGKVLNAAKQLDFTSEVFLYLNIRRPNIFGVPLLYFSEPEFPFNRIYDVGIFSRKMVPDDKNALCLEISCIYGDEIWNMDEDALFNKCLAPLEKHNLLRRQDIEDYHIKRLKHAYPIFRIGYENRLNTIFNYIGQISNLISFGRQGLFAYANVDDVIWMGFEIAKNMKYYDRIDLSVRELLPSYISF